MGYIKHHTIIVTSSIDKLFDKAHERAKTIFNFVCSDKVKGIKNGYNSFFIAPDGSKEGWDDSEIFDLKRKKFIKWLESQAYDDGSSSISYVEVFFGEDNGNSEIVNHN